MQLGSARSSSRALNEPSRAQILGSSKQRAEPSRLASAREPARELGQPSSRPAHPPSSPSTQRPHRPIHPVARRQDAPRRCRHQPAVPCRLPPCRTPECWSPPAAALASTPALRAGGRQPAARHGATSHQPRPPAAAPTLQRRSLPGEARGSWRAACGGAHGGGVRSSRGRRRGEHGRGRGRPSSPKPAIFDSRAPPSSPPRRRLLLPCAGEADCHGSTPAPPSLLSLAAMAGQRRPSAPSLPLRPHSPLLPAPHPLDGHGARCVGGARPQAWVRPTSPSLAATAPPGHAPLQLGRAPSRVLPGRWPAATAVPRLASRLELAREPPSSRAEPTE